MNTIIAICLLLFVPLVYALAGGPFEDATEIAYEMVGAEAAAPMCHPAPISSAQRRALLEALAKVTVAGLSDPTGLTPLFYAVIADDTPSIKRFMALGYSLDTRDIHGGTLLHGAALFGSKQALAFLLANGANLNATSDSGGTPLMVAVSENRVDVARMLLSAGASATWRTKDGVTALHYALVCRDQSLINELILAGAERDVKAHRLAAKFGVRIEPAQR